MLRRALAVVPLLLGLACASPTLPLPPPETPTVGKGADADHVLLSDPCGGAQPDWVVVAINTNPKVTGTNAVTGVRADGCGKWQMQVWAHSGDVLEVTQQSGTDVSQTIDVQIP